MDNSFASTQLEQQLPMSGIIELELGPKLREVLLRFLAEVSDDIDTDKLPLVRDFASCTMMSIKQQEWMTFLMNNKHQRITLLLEESMSSMSRDRLAMNWLDLTRLQERKFFMESMPRLITENVMKTYEKWDSERNESREMKDYLNKLKMQIQKLQAQKEVIFGEIRHMKMKVEELRREEELIRKKNEKSIKEHMQKVEEFWKKEELKRIQLRKDFEEQRKRVMKDRDGKIRRAEVEAERIVAQAHQQAERYLKRTKIGDML